jgi:glucose/arabinose dehydrogenase
MMERVCRLTMVFACLTLGVACEGDDGDGGGGEGTADAAPADTMAPDAESDDASAPDADDTPGDTSTDAGGGGGGLAVVETPSAEECGAPEGATLEHAAVAEGHCAWEFAEVSGPRGIEVDGAGDVLVVSENTNDIVALHDDNDNRVIDDGERTTLVEGGPGLNHGLWLKGDYLYASSASTVYRWPYTAGQQSELTDREVIVDGIPTGGHSTRTLVSREGSDWLYVNFGSRGNVTDNDNRALVKRFDLSSIPEGGYDATEAGEVHADGLRNEVALEFDEQGRLWGMQNGMDNLSRDDLGGDIHADNPGEELNLLDESGEFHGYPYCWSEYNLSDDVGMGPGTQWAMPRFMDDGTHDDAWCQNRDNVRPPELVLQAHQAPLGMEFYRGDELDESLQGDALAALHGSWNRPVPVGYSVVRIPFEDGEPTGVEPFLEYAGDGATDDSEWPHRPVEPAVAQEGTLLVTSDASSRVIAVGATD